MEKTAPLKTHSTSDFRMLKWVLHPMAIVAVSLAVAGGALLTGAEIQALASDEVSLLKLFGGALFLVLIAVFFQQQTRIHQDRSDMERHFAEASGQLDRMISTLEDRQEKSVPEDRLETKL